MPAVFLDHIPLPSLKAYTSVSVLLLSCSIYYALQSTSDWKSFENSSSRDNSSTAMARLNLTLQNHELLEKFLEVFFFMVQEPLCVWTLINMAFCCLILLGKLIQKLVFGELRVVERQHIKDKFWNFVFYKFIFVFGVMNVQYMEEVILWCSWFAVLGFLQLLAQLCKDRYEYLSFSPTTPTLTHVRVFALIFSILFTAGALFTLCISVGIHFGINTFCFMAAECTLVILRTMHVMFRYTIHLSDVKHEGVWEKRATYTYYSDLVFELGGLSVDFFHHLHMLLWGNIFLSMASLVICMQLRFLFNEIQRRLKRHKNYLQIAKHMELNYPVATQEEIESNSDDCAICWDRMDSARKLPCGHLFHTSCLRSWLEQVTTCPTCRMPLTTRESTSTVRDINRNNMLVTDDVLRLPRPPNQTTNHFFHFDGSRYVSWFPSFSVEVSHTSLLGDRLSPPVQTSQLDNMARQVQQMFPNMPLNLILEDLRITRSVEHTVENILDERLVGPPSALFQSPHVRHTILHESLVNRTLAGTSFATPLNESANANVASSSTASRNYDVPSTSNSGTHENVHLESERDAKTFVRTVGEGCRFSKSSLERERMLTRRKEELLKRARSKYLAKKFDDISAQCKNVESDSSSSSDSL